MCIQADNNLVKSPISITALLHSKKGIVILTSGLLYEFQTSEARAKLVCVCVLREFIRNAENTLAMSKLMHR